MPMYEYKCGSCNHEHEHLTFDLDCDAIPCPKCGATSARAISRPAWFRIKGYSEANGYGSRSPHIPAEYKDHVGALEREQEAKRKNDINPE